MKEFIHLFTPIGEWVGLSSGIITVIYMQGNQYRMITLSYQHGEGFFHYFTEERRTQIYPTHVLDLSKLTTKERAIQALEKAFDHFDSHIEEWKGCEGWPGYNSRQPEIDKLRSEL